MKMLKKNKNYILFFIVSSFFAIQPVQAYAGPGVALGALVVFITVLITFFASTILTIFRYLKKVVKFIRRKFNNKNQKIYNKNKNKNKNKKL